MARITEEAAQTYYSNSYNGEWFQLKDHGDVARVQFLHDTMEDLPIFAVHRVKVGNKERYVDCIRNYDEPIDNCPFCAAGIPVKPVRFVLMYDHADGKVKIWERGKQFIAKLQALMNRYNPLSQYVFEIERNGKAGSKDTKYEVYPMDRVEPHDLTDVEDVQLLGGLILDKTFEDMEIYLDTGSFPDTGENNSSTQSSADQVTPRRARASADAEATYSRRQSPVQQAQAEQQPVSRASRASAPTRSRRGGETF